MSISITSQAPSLGASYLLLAKQPRTILGLHRIGSTPPSRVVLTRGYDDYSNSRPFFDDDIFEPGPPTTRWGMARDGDGDQVRFDDFDNSPTGGADAPRVGAGTPFWLADGGSIPPTSTRPPSPYRDWTTEWIPEATSHPETQEADCEDEDGDGTCVVPPPPSPDGRSSRPEHHTLDVVARLQLSATPDFFDDETDASDAFQSMSELKEHQGSKILESDGEQHSSAFRSETRTLLQVLLLRQATKTLLQMLFETNKGLAKWLHEWVATHPLPPMDGNAVPVAWLSELMAAPPVFVDLPNGERHLSVRPLDVAQRIVRVMVHISSEAQADMSDIDAKMTRVAIEALRMSTGCEPDMRGAE